MIHNNILSSRNRTSLLQPLWDNVSSFALLTMSLIVLWTIAAVWYVFDHSLIAHIDYPTTQLLFIDINLFIDLTALTVLKHFDAQHCWLDLYL